MGLHPDDRGGLPRQVLVRVNVNFRPDNGAASASAGQEGTGRADDFAIVYFHNCGPARPTVGVSSVPFATSNSPNRAPTVYLIVHDDDLASVNRALSKAGLLSKRPGLTTWRDGPIGIGVGNEAV